MTQKIRIRIAADGTIRLPKELMEDLDWKSGSYLEVEIVKGTVRFEKIDVDPFEEATKPPEPDSFDRILKQQQESQRKAFDAFEEKIQDPPELNPEDHPDHWR